MDYGLEEYRLISLDELEPYYVDELTMPVENGKRQQINQKAEIELIRKKGKITDVLLRDDEEIKVKVSKVKLKAPVEEMQTAGVVTYYIEDKEWQEELLVCKEKVEKVDYKWCWKQVVDKILY